MPVKLSQRLAATFPVPAKGTELHYDSQASGFGVIVRASGARSWFVQWADSRGIYRRRIIAPIKDLHIEDARDEAREFRNRIRDGFDPDADEAPGIVADLTAKWLDTVRLTRRASTAVRYKAHVDRFILPAFGKFDASALNRNGIEAWHGRIAKETPVQANRALATMSAFCGWLLSGGRIEANPCSRIRRFPESGREVFLNSAEMSVAEAWLERQNPRGAALAVHIALLTGARIGEVLKIKDHHVDFDRGVWIKPASTTKQKRQHVMPIPQSAFPLIREYRTMDEATDSGLRTIIDGLRKLLGRTDVRIHDLRHSVASSLARAGASLPQIGRILGHSAPATTARYAHLVADDLAALVNRARRADITSFPKKRRR